MSNRKIVHGLALVLAAASLATACSAFVKQENSAQTAKINTGNLTACRGIFVKEKPSNQKRFTSKIVNPEINRPKKVAVASGPSKPGGTAVKKAAAEIKIPAKAFFSLSDEERDKVERVIMTSCGGLDNPEMAKANAQVILDRVTSGHFGKTISDVLDAPHQFEVPYKGAVNNIVKEAVRSVFDRGERVSAVRLFYYENPHFSKVDPSVWKKDKTYVVTIGHGKYIHEYWTSNG